MLATMLAVAVGATGPSSGDQDQSGASATATILETPAELIINDDQPMSTTPRSWQIIIDTAFGTRQGYPGADGSEMRTLRLNDGKWALHGPAEGGECLDPRKGSPGTSDPNRGRAIYWITSSRKHMCNPECLQWYWYPDADGVRILIPPGGGINISVWEGNSADYSDNVHCKPPVRFGFD